MLRENRRLSFRSQLDLERMLQDEDVIKLLVVDEGRRVAQKVDIDDYGNVTLGYGKCSLWNAIFNQQEHYSFVELCRSLMRIFSKGKDNSNSKEKEIRVMLGLSNDVANDLFINEDRDAVVYSLFLTYLVVFRRSGKNESDKHQKNNGNHQPCGQGKNGGKEQIKVVREVVEVEVPAKQDPNNIAITTGDGNVLFDKVSGIFWRPKK